MILEEEAIAEEERTTVTCAIIEGRDLAVGIVDTVSVNGKAMITDIAILVVDMTVVNTEPPTDPDPATEMVEIITTTEAISEEVIPLEELTPGTDLAPDPHMALVIIEMSIKRAREMVLCNIYAH